MSTITLIQNLDLKRKDIQVALQIASQDPFLSLTFGPRGGGTGTNGQSLKDG